MIQFSCSNCGNAMSAPYSAGGASGQCPTCGTVVAVPLPVWDSQRSESESSAPLPILEAASEEFPRFEDTPTKSADTPPKSAAEKNPTFLQKQARGCANIVALGFLTLVLALIFSSSSDPTRNATQAPSNPPERSSTAKGYVTVGGYLAAASEADLVRYYEKAEQFINDEDDQALARLKASGIVFQLQGRIPVEIVETKKLNEMTIVRIRGQAVDAWTNIEAARPINSVKDEESLQTTPPSTASASASLAGRWKSTTGDFFLLNSIGSKLTIEVLNSRTMKTGFGTLSFDSSKAFWSGSFSAKFSQDVRNTVRETGIALAVLNDNEVEILADVITWNDNGRETSRVARTMRLRRVK